MITSNTRQFEWRRVLIAMLVNTVAILVTARTTSAQYPQSQFPVRAVPAWTRTVAWQKLGEDVAGDGRRSDGPDGKALWHYHDKSSDTLWFKLEVYGALDTTAAAVSISFDLDAEQGNGLNWYGSNGAFTFDKMISVGLLRREGNTHIGYNGFSIAGEVAIGRYLTSKLGTIAFIADSATRSYLIGVARADLGAHKERVHVIGTVGKSAVWNDDLINTGYATLHLGPPKPR
jgi:hypothetical protein